MASAALADFESDLGQLPDLDDAALADLEQKLVDAFDAADSTNDDVGTQDIADALDQVREEIAKRSSAPAADPVAAPAVEAAAVVPAVIEAAAVTPKPEEGKTVTTTAAAVVPSGHEPVVASARTNTVVAGGDLPGIGVGAEFPTRQSFADALAHRINNIRGVSRVVASGEGEKVLVASIKRQVPTERTLTMGDIDGNLAKIEAFTNVESIVAAGGMCAPLETKYDLFDCGGVTDRPVRDALATFQADRGGIRFFPGPSLGDVTDAVGFWTSTDDEDALDVDGPTKQCVRIECPGEVTAEIQAVTLCMVFGVMQSRVFPELAVANTRLAQVAQARIAEAALLSQIKAGSQLATETAKLSAARDLLDSIGRAVIYYRDKYRLGKATPLRAIFPWWTLEVLRGDIALGDPGANLRGTLSLSDAEITGFFSDRNINVTWALDAPNPAVNAGGYFAINAFATNIPAWPTSLQWALYPEGSWLHLDGGELDLGIVRDSALIKKNDYMQFSETFEAATRIGCESWWITSAIALTGQYMGPRTDPAFLAATAANA